MTSDNWRMVALGGGGWVSLWRWGLLYGRRVKMGYGEWRMRGGRGAVGFLYEGG